MPPRAAWCRSSECSPLPSSCSGGSTDFVLPPPPEATPHPSTGRSRRRSRISAARFFAGHFPRSRRRTRCHAPTCGGWPTRCAPASRVATSPSWRSAASGRRVSGRRPGTSPATSSSRCPSGCWPCRRLASWSPCAAGFPASGRCRSSASSGWPERSSSRLPARVPSTPASGMRCRSFRRWRSWRAWRRSPRCSPARRCRGRWSRSPLLSRWLPPFPWHGPGSTSTRSAAERRTPIAPSPTRAWTSHSGSGRRSPTTASGWRRPASSPTGFIPFAGVARARSSPVTMGSAATGRRRRTARATRRPR